MSGLDRRVRLRGVGLRVFAAEVARVRRVDVASDRRAVNPFSGDIVLMRAHGSVPKLSTEFQRLSRLDQAPLCEIAHKSASAEGPALALFARAHAIDEPAELLRADRDDIAALVRETHPLFAAIGHRREPRPAQ